MQKKQLQVLSEVFQPTAASCR